MKRIFLHIGTHKTGSTSIQRWLHNNQDLLRENGYDLLRSQHTRDNHVELYLASMRYERDSFAKQSMPDVEFNKEYTDSVRQRVQSFLAAEGREKFIFSSEGLSLLRHGDELQTLGEILCSDSAVVTVILVLRDPLDYLNSYREQLLRKKGRAPSRDYWSALYVEDDTWLKNYDALIGAYREKFGADAVRIIDYDEEMRSRGNILPAFLEAIELDTGVLESSDYYAYRLNKTPKPEGPGRVLRWAKSLLKKSGIRP